jgi:hypothetical protein
VVTPGRAALVDMGVTILAGKSAGSVFGSRRERVLPALQRDLAIERELHSPPGRGRLLRF